MYTSNTRIRVHYALTDQMGVVYHGRYAEFFEIGRVEALRQLGITYREIEASGVMMVVTEMCMRFVRPAIYDDLLTITTTVREIPENYRIVFYSEIYNEEGKLLTTGHVTLYFMDAGEMKKTQMPRVIRQKLEEQFQIKGGGSALRTGDSEPG